MACLTSAAVRFANTISTDGTALSKGSGAGVTAGLLVVTILSNVCGVRVCIPQRNRRVRLNANFLQLYGNFERCAKLFKITLILFLLIFMIAVNVGGKSTTYLP